MGRFCYCSKVLPGKVDVIRNRKANKKTHVEDEGPFWQALGMTGFASWLQGDHMIHCLEGESLEKVFTGLREQIQKGNKVALDLHAFYLDAFGKDYRSVEVEPKIECLLDLSVPNKPPASVKKGFFYPLLPHKEQDHRRFRLESSGKKKERHLASMAAFGVYKLTSWLQTTPQGKYIVCYSEREHLDHAANKGLNSPEWQEIAKELIDQTGLSAKDLSPAVEWL